MLTWIRRRPAPSSAAEPQVATPPPEAAISEANLLRENHLDRQAYAEALGRLGGTNDAAALDAISEITARRPGLFPAGDLAELRDSLADAAVRLPANLPVRAALAEAEHLRGNADAAREMFVSIVRDARAEDVLARARPDPAPFRNPALKGMLFQSVDLNDAFVEGEPKDARISARETLMLHWPDLTGKSVLDVGAYSGWFAFEAERRGAAKVTANDYYSWMVNFPAMWAWVDQEQRAGRVPDTYNAPYPAHDPQGLPGRRLFDMTREAFGSRVEPLFGPIDTVDVEPHDVVLLLGVLYHHENPLGLLKRMRSLTRERLIVETLGIEYPAVPNDAAWRFFGRVDDVTHDATTVWAPTARGLRDMLLKAGFSRVELLYGWDSVGSWPDHEAVECRIWCHAWP